MKKIASNLLSKYRNLSPVVKASFWFAVANILQKGISLITTPIFTRVLSTEDYGLVSVYQSWNSLFTIFATLNLSGGVFNNGMVKYEKDRNHFTSSMLGLSTTVATVILIVFLIFGEPISSFLELPVYIIALMFISYIFSPAQQYWAVEQRFQYRYKAVIAVAFASSILTPVVSLVAISLAPQQGEARIVSIIAVQILVGVVAYIYIVHRDHHMYSKYYWKYALKVNVPLIPHYLSSYVLSSSDRIMIQKMCSTSDTALYSLGYTIATLMYLITNAINNSFLPWTYQELKEKKYSSLRKVSNELLALLGVVCILEMLFAPEIVFILGSDKYASAVWTIPPVAASVFFTFLYSLFGNVQFYFENTKKVMYASVITAVSNIVLNYIFIQIFGFIAAAYTTLFCYMLYAGIHYFFMKRECKRKGIEESIYDMRTIIIFSIIMLLSVVICTLTYLNTIVRYGIIVVLFVLIIVMRKRIVAAVKAFMGKDKQA